MTGNYYSSVGKQVGEGRRTADQARKPLSRYFPEVVAMLREVVLDAMRFQWGAVTHAEPGQAG
jgi:hypothetical protein